MDTVRTEHTKKRNGFLSSWKPFLSLSSLSKVVATVASWAFYIVAFGLAGLVVSYFLGWTDYNAVTFLFLSIVILGAALYVVRLKRESRY